MFIPVPLVGVGVEGKEKDDEKEEKKEEKEEKDDKRDQKDEKKEEKDEEKEEKLLKEEKVERSEVPITFSERFQRQLLNAGVMHTSHASLLELTVVSICSSFLAVVFLFHLRWMACGNFSRFYQTSATDVVQAYGWPDSFDRLLALSAEVLLMFFCFERLYDMTLLLHCCVLTLKQRNVALKFLLEHQPPWQLPSLPRATAYCEEVLSCSDFALRLSSARWQLLKRPMEFLVLLAEAGGTALRLSLT